MSTHRHTCTLLSREPLLKPQRRCGPVCKPCHVKQRAGRRKMRGVKGRKQLVRSPEDINLRGETGWQERPSNKVLYYCCKGVCVYVFVCLSSWRITGELEKNVVCLCPSGYNHLYAVNLKSSQNLIPNLGTLLG